MTTIEIIKALRVHCGNKSWNGCQFEREQAATELEAMTKELQETKSHALTIRNYNAELTASLAEVTREHDKEIGDFQNQVREYLIDLTGCQTIDGKGSDSGWEDFTLSEIFQGVSHLSDQIHALQSQLTTAHLDNERLRDALEFYADKSAWHLGEASSRIGVAREGEPIMMFDNGEDHPWSVAQQALTTPTPNPIEQELKELRRDKERLDWLQTNGVTGYWYEESVDKTRPPFGAIRVDCFKQDPIDCDVRQAIDAAINAKKGQNE